MTDDALGLLPKFSDTIKALPAHAPTDADLLPLRLLAESPVEVFYAPFDWINPSARIVICGITPGRHSMEHALFAARAALLEGRSVNEASERGKRTGSFSNMRNALAEMLDELGLNLALRIPSTITLFGADGADRHLLQTTSCVRYPVFVNGKNYNGHSPKLMKCRVLVRFVEDVLGSELQKLPNALVVPCGDAVDDALRHLVDKEIVDPARCLFGFPHASGANGHRKRFFNERKDGLRAKVQAWASAVPQMP